jgi:hypothetical protein
MMADPIISGRAFISLIRPILGITQKRIVSINIAARFDAATVVDVVCYGTNRAGTDIDIQECESQHPENKRFIIDVKEIPAADEGSG